MNDKVQSTFPVSFTKFFQPRQRLFQATVHVQPIGNGEFIHNCNFSRFCPVSCTVTRVRRSRCMQYVQSL